MLSQSATMIDAIQVLNTEALRIVLVVDAQNRLVGTVTDGDIRRSLIKEQSMSSELSEIMNHRPIVSSVNYNRDELLNKMRINNLLHMPIIDHDGEIVGLETLQHLIEKERYDNPVFLMAGGFGTRLRPLTEDTPKPMLNVGSRPILQTILEQFVDVGFHNFYISTHYKADMIKSYFGNGDDWNINIHYIHEEQPLGTAGSLGLLPNDIPELPIILMNGDLLTKVDFIELLTFHNENKSLATMCVREYDFQVPYGVIAADEHRVKSIVEKPVQKYFVNAGVYVLDHSIAKTIDGQTFIEMPIFLNEKIQQGKAVNMFPLHEYWMDIGQIEQYEQAKIDAVRIFN